MFFNISAYKFVHLDRLADRRQQLLELCNRLHLKGTILLSQEGINVFVAGSRSDIDALLGFLREQAEYSGLPIKESQSDEQPFTRMLVRIKKEIIAFGVEGIQPASRTSPKLQPAELKRWLDEGRDVTLLDVRNDYEVQLGTFDQAWPIGIDNFRNFPEAVRALPESLKQKPVVMFCTGGIRCEKAGPFMEREGFQDVYQLDGGILRYFEEQGGQHYQGECFVFDKRVAVDSDLNETPTKQCYACQNPLTISDQKSDRYFEGLHCPYCFRSGEKILEQQLVERNNRIEAICDPLPGSKPYDNHRPLNVPLRFAGLTVESFLTHYHPHVDSDYWRGEIGSARILYKDQPVEPDSIVWAGQRLVHLLAGTVEPPINVNIQVIYEDDQLIAINKPAPLAMHPCGRFNRNTLSYILNAVYRGEKIRMTHRLDANTTGVVVFARKQSAAQYIQSQFENGRVQKKYLARVIGKPLKPHFECRARISSQPETSGIRVVDHDGLEAWTTFHVVREYADGTTLIECHPQTGRTNQIRLHLWSLGLPVVNDPSYLPDMQLGTNQTLALSDAPMCLHAWQLTLRHPETGSPFELQCPLPAWYGS